MSEEPLNVYNYIIAIGFGILLLATSESEDGPDSFFDYDLTDLWRKYEGFFTFSSDMMMELTSIVVLFFTGVFVVAQMLPRYRSLVGNQTKQCFIVTLVGQICWLTCMVYEAPVWVFICSIVTLAGYGAILYLQKKEVKDESLEAYWLIQFPLSLAAGWSFVLFVMSFQVMMAGLEVGGGQAVWTILLLLVMIGAAGGALMKTPISPDYVIPGIIGWSLMGFALGEQRGIEEGALLTTVTILTCLAAVAVICSTIYLSQKAVAKFQTPSDGNNSTEVLNKEATQEEHTKESSQVSTPLNPFSYLSTTAFVVLLVAESSHGNGGPDGMFDYDIAEIWKQYDRSFMTIPEQFNVLLRTVTMLFTGLTVIAQMLPAYRSLVADTSKQLLFAAIVGQIVWLAAMVNEAPTFAFICSTGVLAAFVSILYIQKRTNLDESPDSHLLVRHPLGLSAGWSFVTFLMTFEAMLIGLKVEDAQAFWIIVLLLIMIGVAACVLKYSPIAPDYSFSSILGISMIGMAFGEQRGMEEGAFLKTISILTCLAGFSVIFGAGVLSYIEQKKAITDKSSNVIVEVDEDYKGGTLEVA